MESIIEYKKSIQERLDNADLLVTKTVNLNAKLESELENKNQEIEQLRKELGALKKTNQDLSTKCSQKDEDLEVIKDFFSHMVQVRVQTGSPYEDDQGLWFNISQGNNTISIQKATELIREIAEKEGFEMKEGRVEEIWNEFELKDFDMNRNILRSEMAILIDQILDPFNNKKVDITGQYIQ